MHIDSNHCLKTFHTSFAGFTNKCGTRVAEPLYEANPATTLRAKKRFRQRPDILFLTAASYDPALRLLTWTVNSLNPGATTQYTVNTTLDSYCTRTNQAQVTNLDQTDLDSTPSNQPWNPIRLPLEDDEAQVIASDNCDSTPRIPVLPPMAYLLLCGMLVLVGVRSLRRGN